MRGVVLYAAGGVQHGGVGWGNGRGAIGATLLDRLDAYEQSIAYLSDQTNVIDAEPSERDLGLYNADAGEAFFGLGELEAATEHGHQALNLLGHSQDIAWDRAFRYMTELADRLKPLGASQGVSSLLEEWQPQRGVPCVSLTTWIRGLLPSMAVRRRQTHIIR